MSNNHEAQASSQPIHASMHKPAIVNEILRDETCCISIARKWLSPKKTQERTIRRTAYTHGNEPLGIQDHQNSIYNKYI